MRKLALYAITAALGLSACADDRRPAEEEAAIRAREVEKAAERGRLYGVEPIPVEGLTIDTEYSRLRLLELGSRRSLLFVDDAGKSTVHSSLDLAAPATLAVAYTRTMFASYLFHPVPERVLLVGLGGGSMVRFLERLEPDLTVDAIELDPQIVQIAQDYFGTRPSETIHLIPADGFAFIRTTEERYDVIYMDAFLNPSFETDGAGASLKMKEDSFYGAVLDRLTPDGVVVFNLLPYAELANDIERIGQAFPRTYEFAAPPDLNTIIVATQGDALGVEELLSRGAELDTRLDAGFSFAELVGQLRGRSAEP